RRPPARTRRAAPARTSRAGTMSASSRRRPAARTAPRHPRANAWSRRSSACHTSRYQLPDVPDGTCTMRYMPEHGPSPRERLLAAAVDYVAAHGIGEVSLRQLAAALGTSHRMLVYHFGSKEGLLVEVIRAVEARQRDVLADLATDADLPVDEQARRMW